MLNPKSFATRILITAQDQTKKGFESVKNSLNKVGAAALSVKGAFAFLAPAVIGRGIAGMISGTSRAAQEFDNLAKIAGAGVEEFQKYAFAAQTVGIEQGKLGDIFKDFREKIGEFLQTGGGGMKDFFDQIAPQVGITAEAFRNLSGPEALQLYFDSLEKANLSQEQMSFYLESMASDTTALIPLLRNGGHALRELGTEAERAGKIMDEETVEASRRFNRNLQEIRASAAGVRNEIAGPMIAALARMTTEMFRATRQGETLAGTLERVFRGGVAGDRADIVGAARDIERLTKEYAELQAQVKKYTKSGQDVPDRLSFDLGRVSADLAKANNSYQAFAAELTKPIEVGIKTEEVTRGVETIAEALKSLGVTSDEELTKTANRFEASYQAVVQMGGSLREQREAFSAYAKAAIAANNGIASAALRAQAAVYGVEVATTETGDTIETEMSEAERYLKAVADGADRATRSVRGIGEAAAQTTRELARMNDKASNPSSIVGPALSMIGHTGGTVGGMRGQGNDRAVEAALRYAATRVGSRK